MNQKDVYVLSFGAGVQSTTLLSLMIRKDPRLLKAIEGKSKLPSDVIFADPGAELSSTYDHVQKMRRWSVESGLGFHRVFTNEMKDSEPTILNDIYNHGMVSIPAHLKDESGRKTIGRRMCTRKFKLAPVQNKARRLMGVEKYKEAHKLAYVWIGISVDEIQRMKPSRWKWEVKFYPLIEMGWRRSDCINYLNEVGLSEVGKSSCFFCPFMSNRQWRSIKENDPLAWAEAVRLDEHIRSTSKIKDYDVYLHKSCEPLESAYLGEDQLDLVDMFNNECEGMCGL